MLQYSSVQKRLYCRYFSIDIYFLGGAVLFFVLAQTPLGGIEVEKAVNGTLVTSINYFGVLCLVLGFRGVYNWAVALHKFSAVLIGMFPTMFMVMLCIVSGVFMLFNIFTAAATMSFSALWSSEMQEFIVYWFVLYVWTCGVWLLLSKFVFKHYSKFERANDPSKHAMTCFLLLFLGFFGGHRYYVGRPVTGTLYMATLGFLGIGVLLDVYLLFVRKFTDHTGLPV